MSINVSLSSFILIQLQPQTDMGGDLDRHQGVR